MIRPFVISPAKLENGRSYTLQVNLQESRGTVTINAALNGQQFVKWQGSVDRLSPWEQTALPSPRSVGVMVHDSTATTHSFGVQLTRGGKGYQLGEDWKNPLDVVADAPPKVIAKECVTWNGRHYFVDPKPLTAPVASSETAGVNPGWWDKNPCDKAYACIEWGEE